MNGLLKFITCGSVDDGKSTLIGHILYDAKLLYADQEQALILDSQVGSRGGKIDYSLLLDGLMAEREQGITIDVAYRYFTTSARGFIVADTPGHEEYTRNMAVGASFADLAVILVDASRGVLAQTRRHARICALMGIRRFVFAVNKMDLIGFDKAAFDAIELDITRLSAELGLRHVTVIPLSATEGDNVTKQSDRIPWHKGPALLPFLETTDISPDAPEQGFYMPVQRVCRPDSTFRGFQGQIESGNIRVGDAITALPSGEGAIVKSVIIAGREAEAAEKGQPVTLRLDREVDVSRGCVLEKDSGIRVAKSFSASLLWMDDAPLVTGGEYWLKIGSKLLPATVTAIRHKVDVNTGEHVTASALLKNEIALCDVTMARAAAIDAFGAHKTLGELILIDRVSHATSACGVVEGVDTEKSGAVFDDGTRQVALELFDIFYYRPDLHTIVRKSHERIVYRVGDDLPLVCAGYSYPENFDVKLDDAVLKVRRGKFTGFGPREEEVDLLNERGFGLNGNTLEPYEKYRSIAFEDGDFYEI
ncbi:MAG: sulfate adenylyltransferase subunit CysN [Synergistaceae bacterium]|nr:sulfate adenylyltransferase subunit CysN [Synergistaceae bacterium]